MLQHWSFPAAIEILRFGSQRYPASARVRLALGVGYFGNGSFAEAAQLFQAVLAKEADNTAAADLLGRSCAAQVGTAEPACADLLTFAARAPGNTAASVYAAISILHLPAEQQELATAESLLRSALQADPKLPEAWYQLATVQQSREDWTASADSLQHALPFGLPTRRLITVSRAPTHTSASAKPHRGRSPCSSNTPCKAKRKRKTHEGGDDISHHLQLSGFAAQQLRETARQQSISRRDFLWDALRVTAGSQVLRAIPAAAAPIPRAPKAVVVTFGGGARDAETFAPDGQRNIPFMAAGADPPGDLLYPGHQTRASSATMSPRLRWQQASTRPSTILPPCTRTRQRSSSTCAATCGVPPATPGWSRRATVSAASAKAIIASTARASGRR